MLLAGAACFNKALTSLILTPGNFGNTSHDKISALPSGFVAMNCTASKYIKRSLLLGTYV